MNLAEQSSLHRFKTQQVIVRVWSSGSNPNYQTGAGVGHVSIEIPHPVLTYISLWPKQRLTLENGDLRIVRDEHGIASTVSAKEHEGIKESILNGISHELLTCYEEDLDLENREPELKLCFYSLKKDALISLFLRLKEELSTWVVVPGICENAHSCVSLAWSLLSQGGMDRLYSSVRQSSVAAQESSRGGSQAVRGGSSAFFNTASSRHEEAQHASMQARAGSFYSSEMLVGAFIPSPDALIPRLIEAKQKELSRYPLTERIICEGETNVRAVSSAGASPINHL